MIGLTSSALNSKVLLVGAGGIGCEVLKNIILSGFTNVVVIDLDTIDVSNLNRQFLFQKKHVGKPKSLVAKESVTHINRNANIEAIHDSILKPQYSVEFYKQFAVVANALDNKLARSHVNRMCLAAEVPLIESGSAGYLGQVTLIKKGETECYECIPKPPLKSYPSCTIRNTPSEPIHCVVWSKHLFNQIFGEPDMDEEVSPDQEDLEQENKQEQGDIVRVSTRQWALDCNYDCIKMFDKLFNQDINYLLTMEHLWKDRASPKPLNWDNLPDAVAGSSSQKNEIADHERIWSVKECAEVFEKSLTKIREKALKLSEGDHLTWDKDDEESMDFVAACSNIRAYCFGISQTSRFNVKSMAGNIIPAIATTNAVIAGVVVLHLIKILKGQFEKCKPVFLNKQPNPRKKLLVPCYIDKPNPKCMACSPRSEISIALNLEKTLLSTFEEKILKKELSMVAPDVEFVDKNTILLSSEEGETDDNLNKSLSSFNAVTGSHFRCDDFLQNFTIHIYLIHKDKLPEDVEYEIIGEKPEVLEETKKRKLSTEEDDNNPVKKSKLSDVPADNDVDMQVL